jgi:hypothetical protein
LVSFRGCKCELTYMHNKFNTIHKQYQGQKPHNHFNGCRKSL